MPEKPRLVLAANATQGVGGQGLNLAHMAGAFGPVCELTVIDRKRVPTPRYVTALNRVPIVRKRSDLKTLAADLAFDRGVTKQLSSTTADVFQGAVGQSAMSGAEAKRRGMRVVLDVVNCHVDDLAAHVKRECAKFGLRGFIHPVMHRRILREYEQADSIRVMSKVAGRTFEARGFPKEKIVVATPPTDLSEFPIATFDDPVFKVLFVGMLEPWKGFHLLVEAFSRLRLPKAELVIWSGPGSHAIARYMKKAMAENPAIKMIPKDVRPNRIAEAYAPASLFVLPSFSDGYGYSASEAMASGVPVVVTDNTGVADVVEDGVSGYVVPTGDVRALEERIEHVYKHQDRLPAMGAAARKAVGALTMESFRASMMRAAAPRV